METKEKILSRERLYDGKIFKADKYVVELPDGKTAIREEIAHSGGACALVEEDGEIYFVSQYRLAARTDLIEIPAGKLSEGENPEDAAKRELIEETGILAEELKLIAAVYPSPGYTNERIFIYHCTKFKKVAQKLDEGEFLNVLKIKKDRAFEMIESGEITDGKTVVALLYLKSLSQK